MIRLNSYVLSIAVLIYLAAGASVGSKSNAASTSTQACGNVDHENGRCLEMDTEAMERREGQVD